MLGQAAHGRNADDRARYGSWPPAELHAPPVATADGQPASPRTFPPTGWPTAGQLGYIKEAITVLLLVLALPWLLSKLATDPGGLMSGLGHRAAGRVTS